MRLLPPPFEPPSPPYPHVSPPQVPHVLAQPRPTGQNCCANQRFFCGCGGDGVVRIWRQCPWQIACLSSVHLISVFVQHGIFVPMESEEGAEDFVVPDDAFI